MRCIRHLHLLWPWFVLFGILALFIVLSIPTHGAFLGVLAFAVIYVAIFWGVIYSAGYVFAKGWKAANRH